MTKLDYSFDQWKSLEEEIGSTLYVKTGLINFGTCDSKHSCNDDYLIKHMGVLEASGKPYEWLTPNEIRRRFGGDLLNYPDHWGSVYDPNGGVLLAHKAEN